MANSGANATHNGQRRLLSSQFTVVPKLIMPVAWSGGFGLVTLMLLLSKGDGNSRAFLCVIFFVIWLVGSAYFIFYSSIIKCVETDDTNLYISNYFREITVPLSNVEAVTEHRWSKGNPVTIRFRSPTDFGKTVVLLPRSRLNLFAAHPVVGELRQLAALDSASTRSEASE